MKSITFASNRNQLSLSEDGGFPNKGERNITLGAFIHGGMKGVAKRTLQHHDLTKYLIAFMIHNGSHTQFTSISIVQGDSLKVKHDPLKHRIGSCSVIALGDFKGGELWVQDESPVASTEVTAQDGTNMSGRLVSIASEAAVFDSSKQHKTMPWDGERWTITAYSSSTYDQLEASQVECLRQAGFPLRDQKKELPSSPGIPSTAFNISHPNGIEYSPWKKRFGSAFPGKILPFGCRIDYWDGPKTQRKDRERFEPTAEPGIFLGYNFQPGMKWRKEVLVLPIKDVVRNDYHEYITPVGAYNFTIPEGDFVFPMKDRGDKVALGQATDGLERPSVESLTNQDAEPALEAPSDVPQAEAERRVEVIDPKTGKFVPIPEGGRYYDAGGTLGRRYGGQRGSTKSDSIPSALWPTMSKQQKAEAREEAAREQARALANFQEGGSSSSSAPPAAVARDDKDNWEIVGNRLTRYHYLPRRELFSPDLTDCPVPLSRISNKRTTKIIPIGGIDIIDDEDSWRNVRRRNKKFSFRWIGKTEFTILPIPTPLGGDGAAMANYPAMPVCLNEQEQQREKLGKHFHMSEEGIHDAIAMVARPVGRKELLANPKAQASLDVEWEKLMKKKAWDMLSVREWEDVSREAKKKNKKVHVGKSLRSVSKREVNCP